MLLSAPQSGKSYELRHTAHVLQAMDDEILVTFSKIGDVNFNIKGAFPNTDELQSGYKHVVIIDGLDEAQQRNLNDVVDSIRLFAKEYPTIPIVLSCREGFEMDERLKMFKPLYFEELTMKDVSDYFEASKMNSPRLVKFIRENQEAQELCKTPLGLQNFMNIYLRRHKMPRNKVELYESVIAARKIQMRERPSDAQESLFTNAQMALQRLAIVMMITDSQYLMPEDALKVFDNDESKLNNATYYYNKVFYKNRDGVYVFDNNAMKETFAAKYLSSKTLDEVKHLSCFVDTDQIKPQWANVILMWLQGMENTSNAIDKDVIQWLSSSARDLLVQCDSSCIDAKARFNLFVEIMAKCRHENEMYSAFYTGDFKRLFNFAYQSNYALENYLMQEIVVADEPSYNLYNIYSLCTYIDWDKLRANNVSLYETFTSILMNSIEVYGDKGNFCACYFFFCNNCHFYGDVKYVKQLYSVVKDFKNREAHNALCISIGNGNHSDEYTEYLLTLLPMFKSSEYEFVSCSELYNALSKVKCPSNIIHVLDSVTDREFVRKEYSTDDYQKMMVSLLGNSVIAYQDGNVEIANEVTASFHRLYGEYYFTNRSIRHLLDEYEVFYTTTGFEDEEVKSLISKIRNFGKVDPEERQNRKLNHERCLKELCEYDVFKKRVLNILEQCPDVSDGIPLIGFSSEVGYEHYVQDFFIQYSGLLHFSKASVLSAINSQQTYENFRFIAITRTLVQQSSFVNVGETQKHICRDFGRNILQSFIRKESSPKQNVLETAIQLLVIGIIKLDRQQLLSLMPYSYLNVILPSTQHVGNQASKSLFEFMTEKIGKRAFCKVAMDWLKRRKELQEPTVLSLCSFLIQYGKLDCLEAVYDCMSHYAGKPIFDLIMECFLREKKHINRILHDIDTFVASTQLMIAEHLCMNETYERQVIQVIEHNMSTYNPFYFKQALRFLLKNGSKSALQYACENKEEVFKNGEFLTINYDGIDDLPKLVELFPYVRRLGGIYQTVANSIFESMATIAEQSYDNLSAVSSALTSIASENDDLQFMKRNIEFIKNRYLKARESNYSVEDAVRLI
jgi:hypothetical protein